MNLFLLLGRLCITAVPVGFALWVFDVEPGLRLSLVGLVCALFFAALLPDHKEDA